MLAVHSHVSSGFLLMGSIKFCKKSYEFVQVRSYE